MDAYKNQEISKNTGELFMRILPVVINVYYRACQEARDKYAGLLQRWWRRGSGHWPDPSVARWRLNFDHVNNDLELVLAPPVLYRQVNSHAPLDCPHTPRRLRVKYLMMNYTMETLLNGATSEMKRHLNETVSPLYCHGDCVCNKPPTKCYMRWFMTRNGRSWVYRVLAGDTLTPKTRMSLSYLTRFFHQSVLGKTHIHTPGATLFWSSFLANVASPCKEIRDYMHAIGCDEEFGIIGF
jgi:hypothetical protein